MGLVAMAYRFIGIYIALALLSVSLWAHAQEIPQGAPQTQEHLRDAEFGVTTRQFGLQRRVQMYQWQKQAAAYAKVWSEELIDSGAYPQERRNPTRLPMSSRYWIAENVRLDGKPVDEQVLKQFGQWRDFRPNFSALPGNLAVTFQPEGDGLGSAENPLAPQIGDLRITWCEMALPGLAQRVQLQSGRWVPTDSVAQTTQSTTQLAVADKLPRATAVSRTVSLESGNWRRWAILGIGVALTAAVWRLRRKKH